MIDAAIAITEYRYQENQMASLEIEEPDMFLYEWTSRTCQSWGFLSTFSISYFIWLLLTTVYKKGFRLLHLRLWYRDTIPLSVDVRTSLIALGALRRPVLIQRRAQRKDHGSCFFCPSYSRDIPSKFFESRPDCHKQKRITKLITRIFPLRRINEEYDFAFEAKSR